MIGEYNAEKAKYLYGDDPDALKKLSEDGGLEIGVPAVLGYLSFYLERLGFKNIQKYVLKQSMKPGRLVKLFQTGAENGTQEAFQGLLGKLNSRIANGETKTEAVEAVFTDDLFSEQFLEDFTMGLAGGVGMSVGGATINRALKSDVRSSQVITDYVDEMARLRGIVAITKDESILEKAKARLQELEQDFADFVNHNNGLSEYLSLEQESELKSILNTQDKNRKDLETLKAKLSRKEISESEFL